jgi:DME family drug/metabolite transporter
MYNTTVANANFIIQTQFIFLAIFGYFFLNERISTITLISIILAFSGIIMLMGDNLTSGQTIGNIVAFVMPLSFAVLILVVRKFPNVDMLPLQLTAGLFAMLIGFFLSPTIFVSSKDIFLGFIAGFFQVGIGFILITIGARNTPSAIVGILMLTEAVLGPMWAWLFLNEKPPIVVIFGGSVIILAVFIQFYSMLSKEKNKIK